MNYETFPTHEISIAPRFAHTPAFHPQPRFPPPRHREDVDERSYGSAAAAASSSYGSAAAAAAASSSCVPQRALEEQERVIPMYGSNPIRGMVTSINTNVCSQYGSSSINYSPADYYTGTSWCRVGVLMQEHQTVMYALEARLVSNQWETRAMEPISGLSVYLDTIGSGPYGAFRTNERVSIPGKSGLWTFQLQTQPYFLYVP